MRPLFASLFDSLDGVTYFFVSSSIFVLVTAALFFILGLWIGALTWGRFKRRFRAGQETIEDMKNEMALLKRRTAELAARTPFPQQGGQGRGGSRSALAALVQSASVPPPLPKGAAFSLWTEADWTPREAPAQPLPSSAAFSLWPPREPAVEIVPPSEATTTAASGAGGAVHYTVEHTAPQPKPRNLPRSHAFSIWTEPGFGPAAAPPRAPESPPAPGQTSIVVAAAAAVKSIAGFPKAGSATPTLGDWLHSQAGRPENGNAPRPNHLLSPAEAFQSELSAGAVRNDYLLGIVYDTPPAQRDDLSRLDGISPAERDSLEAIGVHRFKQIAVWNHDHAEEFARRLGMADSAVAARWIGQAVSLLQEMTRGAAS